MITRIISAVKRSFSMAENSLANRERTPTLAFKYEACNMLNASEMRAVLRPKNIDLCMLSAW